MDAKCSPRWSFHQPEGSNRMSTDMARRGEFQAEEGTPGRGSKAVGLEESRESRQSRWRCREGSGV